MIAKGARPGKRIAPVSGVHGDEISPVRTIQTVMDELDPAAMSGAVLAVLDVSRPAIEGMARRWPNSGRGVDLIDMNREWPGNENGPTAPFAARWLVVQQAAQTECGLRHGLSYRDVWNGRDCVPFGPHGPARGARDGGAVSHRSDFR